MSFKKNIRSAAALALLLGVGAAQAASFSFALIGDQEYDASQEAKFPNLRDDINADASIHFTIHDGDIKSGSSLCSDALYQTRYDQFASFAKPFVYVLGDNEWTDCHRPGAGGYNPLERLAKVRAVFHPFGSPSLGTTTMPLLRQSAAYPENVSWSFRGVAFVALNIPGSNNGLAPTTNNQFDAETQAEAVIRNQQNLDWLKKAFASATRSHKAGLMVIIQANPWDYIPSSQLTGYQEFLQTLEAETRAFGKPVVLVHGDSHYFRIDKPLPTVPFDPALDFQPLLWESSAPRLENFTRVETFGTTNVHWLKVTVDTQDPGVFTFRQRIVEKNKVPAAP